MTLRTRSYLALALCALLLLALAAPAGAVSRKQAAGKALNALGSAGGGNRLGTRRNLSKDARRRIAEAQRLRWAKVRKAKLAKS